MNRKKTLILILGFLVSLVITILLGVFGFKYVQDNLITLLFASGTSLSRTVIESSRSVFLMQSEKERDLSTELYLKLAVMEDLSEQTVERLSEYPLVILTDLKGDIINKSFIPNPETSLLLKNFMSLTRPVYEGIEREYTFGIDPDFPGRQVPKGMAVRRGNRVIIVFADTGQMQAEGRGLGFLIRDIAQEPAISYIVLQNPDGVMLASRGVNKISGFGSDSFLRDVYESNHARGKFRHFNGHRVYEVITPFPEMGEFYGVLRVGLSLQEYNAVFTALVIPLVIVFFLLCIMTVLFIDSRYLYRRIKRAEGFREGIKAIEHLVYIEFNGQGMVESTNTTAETLLDMDSGISRIVEFIDEETWEKLKERGRAFETGLLRKGRVFNLTAQRIVSSADVNEERYYLLAEDVTELFDLRQRAENLHHLEGIAELTGTIAHDIRNPLNAISMAVQKLEMKMQRSDDGRTEKLLSTIGVEVHNLNRMVEDFLALSAPVSIRRVPVEIEVFLDEIYQNALMHASEGSIKVELLNNVDRKTIELDSSRLKRAIGNIVKNGIEAALPGSKLSIVADIHDGCFRLAVENKGETIPEDVLKNLFRPVASGKSGGYGLGLFSAYRIVRTHKGDISVKSQAGITVFQVIIPLEEKGSDE